MVLHIPPTPIKVKVSGKEAPIRSALPTDERTLRSRGLASADEDLEGAGLDELLAGFLVPLGGEHGE